MTDLLPLCWIPTRYVLKYLNSFFEWSDIIMSSVFIITILMVIIIYVYMRHKAQKNASRQINTIQDYHDACERIRSHRELRDKYNCHQNYVTKYNSSEDYRERK